MTDLEAVFLNLPKVLVISPNSGRGAHPGWWGGRSFHRKHSGDTVDQAVVFFGGVLFPLRKVLPEGESRSGRGHVEVSDRLPMSGIFFEDG